MKVTTTARHCELDSDVRTFIQQRLERLLRYFRDPADLMEAHVVVAAEKYRHAAEITLKMRRGEVVGREEADDPMAAVDLAAGRIEVQIRRRKDRQLEGKRGGRTREVGAPVDGAAATDDDELDMFADEPAESSGSGDGSRRAPMEE